MKKNQAKLAAELRVDGNVVPWQRLYRQEQITVEFKAICMGAVLADDLARAVYIEACQAKIADTIEQVACMVKNYRRDGG